MRGTGRYGRRSGFDVLRWLAYLLAATSMGSSWRRQERCGHVERRKPVCPDLAKSRRLRFDSLPARVEATSMRFSMTFMSDPDRFASGRAVSHRSLSVRFLSPVCANARDSRISVAGRLRRNQHHLRWAPREMGLLKPRSATLHASWDSQFVTLGAGRDLPRAGSAVTHAVINGA